MRLVLVLLVCLGLGVAAQTPEPGDTELKAGIELAQKKQFVQAEQKFLEGLVLAPQSRSLLYNGGLAAMLADDAPTATRLWSQLKQQEMESPLARAALIQLYQRTGDPAARDQERKELYALQANSPDPKFPARFCRDRFSVGEREVSVFEAFKFEGPFQAKLTFAVYAPGQDHPEPLIQLESSDSDNAFAQESHQLKPGQRMYTLDWNGAHEHRTYAMYMDGEPDYDSLKATVIRILEGKAKPASSSIPAEAR